MFLSADQLTIDRLVAEQLAKPSSRFTYAQGRLVLFGRKIQTAEQARSALKSCAINRLAIAKPDLAPYGLAAQQVLRSMGVDGCGFKLVYGENVSQALQYTVTGNAELGVVALAQMQILPHQPEPAYWLIPQELYHPIHQDGVMLNSSARPSAALEFLAFLRSQQARALIRSSGYQVPAQQHKIHK